jgi:hypothetical protein
MVVAVVRFIMRTPLVQILVLVAVLDMTTLAQLSLAVSQRLVKVLTAAM